MGACTNSKASGAATNTTTVKAAPKIKTSSDGAIIYGDTKFVERMTNSYGSDAVVVEATTDGKGNLTLSNAVADDYRQQNKKTSYAQYNLKAGITNRTGTGKSMDLESHNIDWSKVKTVSGKTYGTQSLMRANGFTWNKAKKIWEK